MVMLVKFENFQISFELSETQVRGFSPRCLVLFQVVVRQDGNCEVFHQASCFKQCLLQSQYLFLAIKSGSKRYGFSRFICTRSFDTNNSQWRGVKCLAALSVVHTSSYLLVSCLLSSFLFITNNVWICSIMRSVSLNFFDVPHIYVAGNFQDFNRNGHDANLCQLYPISILCNILPR